MTNPRQLPQLGLRLSCVTRRGRKTRDMQTTHTEADDPTASSDLLTSSVSNYWETAQRR